MPPIVISKKELRTAVKEGVREVLGQELMKLYAILIPFVSEKEQRDIERFYRKPSHNVAKSENLNADASNQGVHCC
jgi:hypothetical protein